MYCTGTIPRRDNDIVGEDGIPEYTDFKQERWLDYLDDNCRTKIDSFRQELNMQVLYETSSCSNYAKAHGTGSKASSGSKGPPSANKFD
jgi:hypothetical protein